ncbi:MAG: hypothetical protein K9N51_10255, partial [Candidatus Pacebacteria bacterium]|nr:hypothetical protein [Candidatus Paceibacterota bacterium]
IVLVLSGTGVDRRRRLYKACRDAGEVVVCEKPDIRDRDWQDKVRALIEKRAGEAGVTLPRDAVDYLVEAFGTDTALIHCELEKLATYAGGTGQAVTLEEVQLLCHGEGEAISWSLRDAVGERDIARVLDIVDTLLRGERDTEGAIIGLVLQVANHVRNLLQARVMMQELKCRDERQFQAILDTFDKGQQASYRERGLEVATYHPYRARMIAKQALNYSGSELVAAVPLFRDAYYECVSSSIANRIVLERTLMALCAK